MAEVLVKAPKAVKKKRPFLKFIKIVFIFIFILVLLIAGAFTVAYFTIDPQVMVTKASEVLKEKYNREIEVRTVQFSIIKGISLDGIELSRKGGFSQGSALDLKEGSILYNPLALLMGELDIIKIRLAGFYTTYDNIMDIVSDFSRSDKTEKKTEETDKKGPGIFRISIRSIEVDDAQIVYNNIPLNIKALVIPAKILDDSQIKASLGSMYGTIHYDGSLKKANVSIEEMDAGKFAPGSGDIRVNQIFFTLLKEDANRYTVIGKSLDMVAQGYKISTFTRFEGSYGIKSQTVLLRNLGVKVNEATLYLDRLTYFVKNKQLDVNITNLTAQLSDLVPGFKGKVTGSLDVVKSSRWIVGGDLKIEDFQYKFIQDGKLTIHIKDNVLQAGLKLSTSGGDLNLSAQSDDFINSSTTLSLNSDKFDLYPIVLNFQSTRGNTGSETNTSPKKEGNFALPPLVFKAHVDKLSYQEYSLDDVSLIALYQGGGLDLEKFSLGFIGGRLDGSGKLVGNQFNGQVHYQDGNLRKFSEKYLKDGKKLYGTVNADSHFRINLKDPLSSVMDFTLNMQGGEIIDFLLLEKINKLLFFIPADNIQFDTIQTSLLMREGTIQIKNLDFLSTDLKITTTGEVFLDKKSQDINMLISIHKRYLEGGAFVAQPFIPGKRVGERIENVVQITGDFKNPSVKLNP